MNKETKAKISKSKLGSKLSEETKAKISKSRMGQRLSDEHKIKISTALKRKRNPCKNCGAECKKHKQIYCTNKCQQKYQSTVVLKRWLNGVDNGIRKQANTSKVIRDYIFQKYKYSCCKCGWNKINNRTKISPLQLHHIDGNCENNLETNLELLCPNCHALTQNYCALNYKYSKRKR